MAVKAMTLENKSINLFPVFISFIIMLAGYGVIHAISRHGEDAIKAMQCYEGGGEIVQMWRNPLTGRDGYICITQEKEFAVIIKEGSDYVTAMIKEKVSRIEQVERYMLNRGYELLWRAR